MNQTCSMLLDAMKQSISKTMDAAGVTNGGDYSIGVAFSGGVDSTLLATVLSHMSLPPMTLLTVGFRDSHDLEFSRTVNLACLGLKNRSMIIEPEKFAEDVNTISNIIKTDNLSWLENCIAFYYISKIAQDNNISKVVTANGIDELFCGYDAYRRIYIQGQQAIQRLMDEKLNNEVRMSRAINTVSSAYNVQILQPLLHPVFVDAAKKVPISEKIYGSDDMLRKHTIRKLAEQIGIHDISYTKKKKSLQYGSGIHKALLRVRRSGP